MNINLIITISIYCLFFLSLIIGFFIGLARGLKKSSLRLGSLILFLIIAGLITPVISKALLTINLSSFNININGQAVSTIPELVRNSLFSIQGFQEVATSIPSVMTLVDGLPVALMNVIVFTLLTFIMMFLSWILYVILSHTVLRETKLEKQIKKQKKLEKKNKEALKKPELDPNKPKAIPLGPPNKRRLWGALIGSVQGFLLLFLILMPIISLSGSFGEVMSGPATTNTQNSLTVYAEENELLSEYSSDIIKNLLGEEIVSYFGTFNNAIPTKILTIGGLSNSIFDSLSTVKVNGEGIAIRRDAVIATKVYDKYMMVIEEIGQNDKFEKLDFKIVRDAVDMVFETGLFRAFAEDGIPYALNIFLDSEMFLEINYSIEIQESAEFLIESYKNDIAGFVRSLKNDMSVLLNISESALKCGLVDEAITDLSDYNSLIDTVKATNYKFLSDFTNNAYNSYLFRILTSKGLNIFLDIASTQLSQTTPANLGTTNYEQINWTLLKSPLFNLLKNTLDIYDILNLYEISNITTNPKNFVSVISSEDLNSLLTLLGKEIDFIKNSPLFVGQTNNPVKGLIVWLGEQELLNQIIDSQAMLAVNNWETELNSLSNSVIGLKDSGSLDLILSDNFGDNLNLFMENLLDPISEEPEAETYIKYILNPILSSSITKKFVVFGLNQINSAFSNSGLIINEFTTQSLKNDQNNDIILMAENFANCFSMFYEKEIDLETIDTAKLADLLTALQSNAFRKGTLSELDNSKVNLSQKTVTNGGIFANYYIALVTYVVGDDVNIDYKNVNWLSFFESAQSLSDSISEITEGSLEDFINLGDEATQESLQNLLDSLGLDGSIVSDLSDIQGAVNDLSSGVLEGEALENAFNTINSALENILNSTDGQGTSTVDTIVNMIQTITGENLSDKISSEVIASEQTVSNRLHLMTANYSVEIPLNCTDLTPDSIHNELRIIDATILDLTCGATYVLQQAVNSGTKIYVTNIDFATLTSKINSATSNEEIITLTSSLFEIMD